MGWHKFNARKTIIDGISFPSQLEADTYSYLLLLQKAGEISELKHHDTVFLTKAKISYQADFKFLDNVTHTYHWGEAKGVVGDRWRLIQKLWPYYGLGPLHVYVRGKRHGLSERVIIPFVREDL